MRILIVEDEVIIAEDLADIVRAKGFKAECAHSFDEAQLMVKQFEPELIFCDIDLGEGGERDGVALIKAIREEHPLIEVVYISALVTESVIMRAQQTRPHSYIVKPFNAKQVMVTASMIRDSVQVKHQLQAKLNELTEAEQKVLQFVAKGLTSKEIAAKLFVSEKTVRNHRYNILKKLDLPNENNSLTKWAMAHFDLNT